VDDAVRVQVVERGDELARDRADDRLRERLVVLEDLEELALRELGHDRKVGARLKGVEHLDDVRVAQRAQDLDLLAERLQVALGLAALGDQLDRDRLEGALAARLPDLRSRAGGAA
jgi:hypothetical protein